MNLGRQIELPLRKQVLYIHMRYLNPSRLTAFIDYIQFDDPTYVNLGRQGKLPQQGVGTYGCASYMKTAR